MELERELIQIDKRQKELDALKEVKPIDYLSNAFGGLYIESKKNILKNLFLWGDL